MADSETQGQPQAAPIAPEIPGIPAPPALDMSWARVPTARPAKPTIGAEGFTLKMADAGEYAYAPDHWPYENDTPRGSYPAKDRGLPAPYTIYEKAEVWAENCADLYEAAIREQWKPATQVSWSSIEPLPDHIEASLDQIFSNISEQQYNSNAVLMGWLKEISYGYHEVKLYLATQTFDQARHVEAFRKRALANGGGLGVQAPGFLSRAVFAAFKFTELTVYVNIIRTAFLLALCERGDAIGRSQADRQLFELTANDLRRHLAYGVEHLRHYLLQGDDAKRRNVRAWLERGEIMLAADLRRDRPLREALILVLGGSVQAGKTALRELRQAQLRRYLRALESATFVGHEQHVNPALTEIIDNP
ncbi:MAG: hypothetical protein KGK07_04105 [Chloroflexota bacterium]|nr:hypothetical protein [Chloroflexota bacterium]